MTDAFPFSLIQVESSFRDNQQIRGPMIPPNGNKKPANADKWQNIAQFLSVSDNTLMSFMIFLIYYKDGIIHTMLHYQNLASRFQSAATNPFGVFASYICIL